MKHRPPEAKRATVTSRLPRNLAPPEPERVKFDERSHTVLAMEHGATESCAVQSLVMLKLVNVNHLDVMLGKAPIKNRSRRTRRVRSEENQYGEAFRHRHRQMILQNRARVNAPLHDDVLAFPEGRVT